MSVWTVVLDDGILPEPLGVKVAAAAAFGDMPSLTGCAAAVLGVKAGVKDGESTLRLFFELQDLSLVLLLQEDQTDLPSPLEAIKLKSWLKLHVPSWYFRHCGPLRHSCWLIGR